MADVYSFRMTWRFAAPIETVWRMINTPEEWPQWWKNCKNVEKLDADTRRFSMQTQLPYTLRFDVRTTKSEEPRLLEGNVEGQLAGTVRWELSQDDGTTTLRYFWDVAPTRAWMRAVSGIMKPVFVWNHRAMMRNGGQGLSKMIGAPLVYEEYR